MIFLESMYHNMRIHVIFLPPYFLLCPNFKRPHTKVKNNNYMVDRNEEPNGISKKYPPKKYERNKPTIKTIKKWFRDFQEKGTCHQQLIITQLCSMFLFWKSHHFLVVFIFCSNSFLPYVLGKFLRISVGLFVCINQATVIHYFNWKFACYWMYNLFLKARFEQYYSIMST